MWVSAVDSTGRSDVFADHSADHPANHPADRLADRLADHPADIRANVTAIISPQLGSVASAHWCTHINSLRGAVVISYTYPHDCPVQYLDHLICGRFADPSCEVLIPAANGRESNYISCSSFCKDNGSDLYFGMCIAKRVAKPPIARRGHERETSCFIQQVARIHPTSTSPGNSQHISRRRRQRVRLR